MSRLAAPLLVQPAVWMWPPVHQELVRLVPFLLSLERVELVRAPPSQLKLVPHWPVQVAICPCQAVQAAPSVVMWLCRVVILRHLDLCESDLDLLMGALRAMWHWSLVTHLLAVPGLCLCVQVHQPLAVVPRCPLLLALLWTTLVLAATLVFTAVPPQHDLALLTFPQCHQCRVEALVFPLVPAPDLQELFLFRLDLHPLERAATSLCRSDQVLLEVVMWQSLLVPCPVQVAQLAVFYFLLAMVLRAHPMEVLSLCPVDLALVVLVAMLVLLLEDRALVLVAHCHSPPEQVVATVGISMFRLAAPLLDQPAVWMWPPVHQELVRLVPFLLSLERVELVRGPLSL
jgi:hypothetical protein